LAKPLFFWVKLPTLGNTFNSSRLNFYLLAKPLFFWVKLLILGNCCNLNLGLITKARACKVAGQKGSPGVTFHAPKSAKNVRE
jgi:hypothetical protein